MISGLWSLFFLISSQKGELPNMQSGVKNVPKTQPNPVGAQDSYKGYLKNTPKTAISQKV